MSPSFGVSFTLDVLCVQANSKQEVLARRNSFTPMSSQDQVKRLRVFSVGNPPRTPLPPSLSSTDVPEAQENDEQLVRALTVYTYA
ncbi:6-phosphofructo-2-kinase/fructose-2,6-bisphosphatase 2a [Tachysurus ichikawai]